jgi:hypothetical protein
MFGNCAFSWTESDPRSLTWSYFTRQQQKSQFVVRVVVYAINIAYKHYHYYYYYYYHYYSNSTRYHH